MLSPEVARILSMYENLGCSVEEIAAETDKEPLLIKSVLAQHSRRFTEAAARGDSAAEADVSEDDFRLVKETMRNLLYSEEDGIRYKAAQFLWDEKKGRREAVLKQVGGMHITINTFNQHLIEARERLASIGNGAGDGYKKDTPIVDV